MIIIFVGMGATVLKVSLGDGPKPKEAWKDRFATTAPILGFLLLVLVLGVYIPAPLEGALHEAVTWLEGSP